MKVRIFDGFCVRTEPTFDDMESARAWVESDPEELAILQHVMIVPANALYYERSKRGKLKRIEDVE